MSINGIDEALRDVLNRHGYSFQYAVLRRAIELYEDRLSSWSPVVAELPVEANGVAY